MSVERRRYSPTTSLIMRFGMLLVITSFDANFMGDFRFSRSTNLGKRRYNPPPLEQSDFAARYTCLDYVSSSASE